MRFEFILLPAAAAVLAASPAVAEQFLTVEQAQQLMFPGARFAPADIALSEADMTRLQKAAGSTVFRSKVKVWRVSSGGWFILDQVLGRDDRITYAVGLTAEGAVKSIEVLVCLDAYGQVRRPAWRRQFVGKRHRASNLAREVSLISGTTLSSAHIIEGVARVLATYALFLAPASK